MKPAGLHPSPIADEHVLRTVLDRLAEAVVEVDGAGAIRWCNAATAQLMGYEPRYLIGQTVWEALNLETRTGRRLRAGDLPIGGLRAVRQTGAQEWLLDHPAVGLRPVSLTAIPTSDGGALILLRPCGGEAGSADRDTSELLSTVSHDMRSPITSILGLTELMLTHDTPPEKMRRYLEVILQDAARLRALVEDLLDYERIRSGRQVFRLAPVSLPELLERTAAKYADSGHPIAVEVPAGLPAALGHPDGLARVLDNLLCNADKYSADGSPIVVAARVQAGEVIVSVRDRGQGFDPQWGEKLFERFFRLPEARATEACGSGLGLAIVREIVQAVGGRVWAHSDGPGTGSTFAFALAVAE